MDMTFELKGPVYPYKCVLSDRITSGQPRHANQDTLVFTLQEICGQMRPRPHRQVI